LSVFKIDRVEYPSVYVTKLTRSFNILDGENAGRVKIGDMVRDVIGTYYNYSMELDTSEASLAEYDALYEVLSSPDDYHTVVVPYGQTTLEFKAYITNGDDELLSMENKRNLWGKLKVNFIAMQPQRRPS